MSLLTSEQFATTFGQPAERIGIEERPPFDFWPYFDAIPAPDFEGHDCSEGRVEHAWRMPPGRFLHILIDSQDHNVFMVVVLDLYAGMVFGHKLLNLNREYGINSRREVS